MSSAEIAAKLVKDLEDEDWSILLSLERALAGHQAVRQEYIARVAGLHQDKVRFRLRGLHKRGLIGRSPAGYSLISAGLDAIALNSFVKKNLLAGLGRPIGIGKESDVFEALGEDGGIFAVKFYRIGRISFRAYRRKRSYSSPLAQHHWLSISILAAKREFEALRRLYPLNISVPRAIIRERHAILMEKIDGLTLTEYHRLKNPKDVLGQILANIRSAYLDGGIVNADLSEFNILYDGDRVWIIDWPQTVDRKHPNSSMLLDRDVFNILNFFRRRFKVECPLESASFYVRGWREKVQIF